MLFFSKASREYIDIRVILVSVIFVKYDNAGSETIFPLGVVGMSFDRRIVFQADDLFLRPFVEAAQLRLVVFKRSDKVLYRTRCLILIIGTDVYIVFPDRIVRTGQCHALNRNDPIFTSASTDQAEQDIPSRHTGILVECAKMKSEHEFFPFIQAFEAKILAQSKILPCQLFIHIYLSAFECWQDDMVHQVELFLSKMFGMIVH